MIIKTTQSVSVGSAYSGATGTEKAPDRKDAEKGAYPEKSGISFDISEFRMNLQKILVRGITQQAEAATKIEASDFSLSSLWYSENNTGEASSVEEYTDLFSEDGYFGVKKTSGRIIDFVTSGSGGDLNRLRAGREGVIKGFEEAEKAWGGKLPDISYETLNAALEGIDEAIQNLGGSVLDVSV